MPLIFSYLLTLSIINPYIGNKKLYILLILIIKFIIVQMISFIFKHNLFMSITIPTCQELSIEGIRNILLKLNEKISDLQKHNSVLQNELTNEVKIRPTIKEVISCLSNTKEIPCQFYVSVPTINNILEQYSEGVEKNLQNLAAATNKQQEVLNALIEKVQACVNICHDKYKKSLAISNKNLKYVYTHLQQMFVMNKKAKIFARWRKISENNHKAANKIADLLKKSIKKQKTKTIHR